MSNTSHSSHAMEENHWSSSYFSFMRTLPFPTLYSENKTAATVDVLEVGWLVAFSVLAVAFYVLVLCQPRKTVFLVFIRITFGLLLGLIIMWCNFGQDWEVGNLTTHTAYRAGSPSEVTANIGMKMGLRGVNITLKAIHPPENDLAGEIINYNEQFRWTWAQGRFGFGPFAGHIQRDFRVHQRRGTPLPILWVAEYFTFDGEGLRFGRHYRVAGWYAHICIWTAFPAWILTVILFMMVVSYGAIMLSITGACLTSAAILWASIRNPIELEIPFSPPVGILKTHYGHHWYLALITGLLCLGAGLVIWVLDYYYHDQVCALLGINPMCYLEEEYEENNGGFDNGATDDSEGQHRQIPLVQVNTRHENLPLPPVPSLSVRFRGRGTSIHNWRTVQLPASAPLQQEPGSSPGPIQNPIQFRVPTSSSPNMHRQGHASPIPPTGRAPPLPSSSRTPDLPAPLSSVTPQLLITHPTQPLYSNIKQSKMQPQLQHQLQQQLQPQLQRQLQQQLQPQLQHQLQQQLQQPSEEQSFYENDPTHAAPPVPSRPR